ncbi:CHAT domain-containing protein [Nostoc muscorum FACHB-395]|nr:CHAT domain-containing protein [Desmonostoc muscorum FACHB-395]
MIKRRDWAKYFFLSIAGLFTFNNKAFIAPAYATDKRHNQAQLLTQRGKKFFDEGRAVEALQDWEEATKIYGQIHYQEGVTGSLINQNYALQALGLNRRACTTLLQALKLDTDADICAIPSEQSTESTTELLTKAIDQQKLTPLNLLAWHNLADVLRSIGKLNESKIVLEKILSTVKNISSADRSRILLSLGNTENSFYKQARDNYTSIEEPAFKKEANFLVQKKALESLDIYQRINNSSTTSQEVQLQSQLQRLNLLLDFQEWLTIEVRLGKTNLATVRASITQQIQPAIDLVLKNSSTFSRLPASQSVYAKLNFANSLNQISDQQLHSVAIVYAKSALQTAQSTNNHRLKSESFGTLGKLNPKQSQTYFEQALSQAQSVWASDIAYQWQQKLGNLYQRQKRTKAALQAYGAAIENITQVRRNLLPNNADLQFSFQEKVEPIYREYMRLLLASPNPDLKRVIQTNERLQIAQLENFLQCGNLEIIPLNEVKNLPSAPIVIHIIDLDESVEVILQLADGSLHSHSVDSKLVKTNVDNLLEILQSLRLSSTSEIDILSFPRSLYDLLIAPIKTYLPPSGTLVFTLDTSFQSLPIGLLHDGNDYLFKYYSIAQTLGSRVRQPKLLLKDQLRALIGGLSEINPSIRTLNVLENMEALPKVKEEIEYIKQQTSSSKVLLNEKFTSQALGEQLSSFNFPIVHLTTHAQFSSEAKRTMFFTWDKTINALEFYSLLKFSARSNEDGIELLVLSACQTAKGNKRSALGIAGVAAQAGARSTVATLWKVDADSTALLMEQFYKNLKNGVPKAEALRQAQLNLISDSRYSHPYFWAGFILVGGWL